MKKKVIIITLLCIGTTVLTFSGFNAFKGKAKVEPVWENTYMKESYTDLDELLADYEKAKDARNEFINSNDFTVKEKNDILKQWNESISAIEEKSTVVLSDAIPSTAEGIIGDMEKLIEALSKRSYGLKGSAYSVYIARLMIRWVEQDESRAELLTAFNLAIDNNEKELRPVSPDSFVYQNYNNPENVPEQLAKDLENYEKWERELRTLDRLPQYIGYTGAGKHFDHEFTREVFDVLEENSDMTVEEALKQVIASKQ